jgi:hypothetical protein
MKRAIAILMLSGGSLASADTCGDTSTFAITSQDGDYAVRIDSGSPEESGKKRSDCVATLTKWDSKEQSFKFFRRLTLRNPIRPRTAVITYDAQFLVTFDDYCESGRTPNAIVIYDLERGTSHAHALEDFLPPAYRKTLEDSISNTLWRGEPSVTKWAHPHTVYVDSPDDYDGSEGYIVIDAEKNTITLEKGAPKRKP